MPDYHYESMKTADETYQRELVRAYGGNAGDARYKMSHSDQAVQQAKLAFHAASDAWRSALRARRG